MEIIERIENLIANPEGKSFESEGINPTFYWAYRNTRRTENPEHIPKGKESVPFEYSEISADLPLYAKSLENLDIQGLQGFFLVHHGFKGNET